MRRRRLRLRRLTTGHSEVWGLALPIALARSLRAHGYDELDWYLTDEGVLLVPASGDPPPPIDVEGRVRRWRR